MANKNIVFVGDPHAHPDFDNLRWRAVANFCIDNNIDYLVNMGDHQDFPSLSGWDRGSRSIEGRRIQYDIEAGQDAMDQFQGVIDDYNRGRKRKFQIEKHMIRGNHPQRYAKYIEFNPALSATLSMNDLGEEERGWKVTNFRDTLELEGFYLTHYFANPGTGKPIGAVHMGEAIFRRFGVAGLQGHNHLLSVSYATRGDGQKLFCGSLGHFSHQNDRPEYARATAHTWWNGIVSVFDTDGKGFASEFRFIEQERLLKEYM